MCLITPEYAYNIPVIIMKNTILLTFVLLLLFGFSVTSSAAFEPDVSAKSAVVICAESGEVVYSKNSSEKMPMASTTKIMTSVLALEYGATDELVTVSKEMVTVEGSSIGLKPDDKISLKTLVKGMLLESGNDAANCTAYIVGGNMPDFVRLMNEKAKALGMTDTSFETASGLDGENHYSTAYDMALLGAYAIKNPEFRKICSSCEEAVYYGNEPFRRVFSNSNKLLKRYDGVFGIKTGFTKKSGRCLVTAAEKQGKTLIVVTLNAPDDWNDHTKLYDYSFESVYSHTLSCNISDCYVKIVGGESESVGLKITENPVITSISKDYKYSSKIFLKQFEYAPVHKNDCMGYVEYYNAENRLVATADIVADCDVKAEEFIVQNKSFFEKLIDIFR